MKPDIEYVYNKLKELRFDFKESDRKLFPNEYTFDYSLDRYVRVDGNDLYISKDTFKSLEEELEYADSCHKLEEEIGYSLRVLIRALNDGIYVNARKHAGTKFVEVFEHFDVTFNGLSILFIESNYPFISPLSSEFYASDYKKTWWLKKDKSE